MTIKELVEQQKIYKFNDEQLITMYLIEDDHLDKILDILVSSYKNKINEQINWKNRVCSNISLSTSHYYSYFGIDDGSQFDTLTRQMILDIPFSDRQLKWLEETVPKYKQPNAIWRDLNDYIITDLGLSWKE